jgi:hypothetical protein
MITKIGCSNVCSAFDLFVIGSRVTDKLVFTQILAEEIAKHDFTQDRIPGQGFLVMPPEIHASVSAGDGLRSQNPAAYIPAIHRNKVDLFLKRKYAGTVTYCACVIYTIEAYKLDPEVLADEIATLNGCTHVLVAVIASSSPSSPLSPYRLVANLAGGNKEAQVWSADEIRAKAKESIEFWDKYCVVAG